MKSLKTKVVEETMAVDKEIVELSGSQPLTGLNDHAETKLW